MMNHSLYEFLLPEEARPAEDRVLSHTIIKADVRGSTKITQDLLARGLNPASLFSLNFYEPVKRILDRYGAAKVFIEGDALVLAIFETESNRAQQRAVSKACALARQILAVSSAYNERPESSDLPRLELGVGIAFQGSAPTYWMDTDSRIMISRALNLSDRLSSCSKAAKRMLAESLAVPPVSVPDHDGGRGRGRGRRIPDSLQFERRGIERRRFPEAAGRNRADIAGGRLRDALGQGTRHVLRRGNAGGRGRRARPDPPRFTSGNCCPAAKSAKPARAPITKSAPTQGVGAGRISHRYGQRRPCPRDEVAG
jgi:hypothetical protein